MKVRINFLDNLRTFLIFLVVVIHAGLVYEQVLENIWIVCDPVKNNSIGLVRMYLDLFVMFGIFFISGYLIPFSIKNKTTIQFIKSKFKRIMVPWIIAVFTLIPAYKFIFLYSRGLPQEGWFTYFHFFQRAGTDLVFYSNNPNQNWLWFLPVLFLFQVLYLALKKGNLLSLKISLRTGVLLTFVIGLGYSMVISHYNLRGWVDTAILHFQRERLLVYFMAFLLGSLCNKQKIFNSTTTNKKAYILSNVVFSISMAVFTTVALNFFFNIVNPGREYYFISEYVDRIFYYSSALLIMLSITHILTYVFRNYFNKTNRVMSQFNKSSYSVYIIHTIVTGVIALALLKVDIPALFKYFILILSTFIVSNMITYSYQKIIQKTINMKTIVSSIIVIFILGAAFHDNSQNTREIKEPASKPIPSPQQHVGLHEAAVTGNIQAIQHHIQQDSDLNEKDPNGGSTPMIIACVFGKTEAASLLIKAGADVNATNNEGSTALHTAAFFCREEIVNALLANGVDKSIKNKAGSTALESVLVPFEAVQGIYEYFGKIYEPLGLTFDMEQLRTTRPIIAEILRNN